MAGLTNRPVSSNQDEPITSAAPSIPNIEQEMSEQVEISSDIPLAESGQTDAVAPGPAPMQPEESLLIADKGDLVTDDSFIAGRIDYNQLDSNAQEFVNEARADGLEDEAIASFLEDQGISPARTTESQQQEMFRAQAVEMGMSDAQVQRFMNERAVEGLTPDQLAQPASDYTWQSDVPTVEDTEPGQTGDVSFPDVQLPFEEVRELAMETGADPTTEQGMNLIYSEASRRKHRNTQSSSEIGGRIARLQTLTKPYEGFERPWSWMRAQFGEGASYEFEQRRNESVQHIVNMAAERGMDIVYENGSFLAQDNNGETRHVNPSFLQEIGRAKYEITGGVIGGLAPWLVPAYRSLGGAGPYGRAAQIAVGGSLAVAGAVGGGQIDYLAAGIKEHEDWEANIALERAMSSAELGVLGEVVGYGVFKVGAAGLRQIKHAYEYARNGNKEGAYRALKESAGGISDEQVTQIISRWENLNQERTTGSLANKALHVLPETGLADKAATAGVRYSTVAGNRISARVNDRAQDLLSTIDSAATPDLPRRLMSELDAYETDVRTLFDTVKRDGQNLLPETYQFNVDKVALQPLIKHQINTITDPAVANRFMRVLENVDALTEGRSFSDLLELRQVANSLRYNRNIKSANDHQALNEVLGSINSEIESAVGQAEGGQQWLRSYRDANSKYSQYKRLQDNVLFKAVSRRESVSPDDVAKQLVKYGRSMDNTYEEVVSKLSPEMRKGVEMSIVDQITQTNTQGAREGMKAIDFVELSHTLKDFSFKSGGDAARIRRAVDEFSEVYKNDPRLGFEAGGIEIPRFQSYLTTDPVVRAQFALASAVFNRARSLLAGDKADSISMVQNVAKLLENPLNSRSVNAVVSELKDNPQLMQMYEQFQQEAVRHRGSSQARAKLYRDKSGRMFMQPGEGRTAVDEALPTHRLIGEDEVRERLGMRKINAKTLTREKKMRLMEEGHSAIVFENGQVLKLY